MRFLWLAPKSGRKRIAGDGFVLFLVFPCDLVKDKHDSSATILRPKIPARNMVPRPFDSSTKYISQVLIVALGIVALIEASCRNIYLKLANYSLNKRV